MHREGEGEISQAQRQTGQDQAAVVEAPSQDDPRREEGVGQQGEDRHDRPQLFGRFDVFREGGPLPDDECRQEKKGGGDKKRVCGSFC